MGKLEPEYPLAEIPIISNKNTLLLLGNRENFRIRGTLRIAPADLRCVVAKLFEVGEQAGVSTLVKQKFHTWGGGVPRCFSPAWWGYFKQALTLARGRAG